jgi:O-methyltransferase involved in polyketide biosynthesis
VHDPFAVRILDELKQDRSLFNGGWKSQLGIAIRTWLLDREVSRYLAQHPGGTVVILGCGLDARSSRLDNGLAQWINLDLPEVIGLRDRLMPSEERHRNHAASVLDHDAWFGLVPVSPPPLFVAEGLFMYLPGDDLMTLMRALADRYPSAEILIESLSRRRAGLTHRHDLVSRFDAKFKWGIDSGRDFESWHPGIEFIDEWPYFDFQTARWHWLGLLRWFPFVRRAIKISRLRFRPRAEGPAS